MMRDEGFWLQGKISIAMYRRRRLAKKVAENFSSVETSQGNISFLLKRSSARRTLAITINEKAQVRVAVPYFSSVREIEVFIEEKAGWILRGILEQRRNRAVLDQKKFEDGQEFLFLGRKFPLSLQFQDAKRSRITFNGVKWEVVLSRDLDQKQQAREMKRKLIQWYREQAQEIIGGRIFHYSRIMQVEPQKIAVRTQKRLWGCCDYRTQTIHINWQVILSPMSVVDYVVVHELCHLKVPNHSKRFWHMVSKFFPDYACQVKWLKENSLDMVLP
jgi:hypothetical protein